MKTQEERLAFLQGTIYACSMRDLDHDESHLLIAAIAKQWGLTSKEFLAGALEWREEIVLDAVGAIASEKLSKERGN